MGFLDNIFGKGKEEAKGEEAAKPPTITSTKGAPFTISTSFSPVRLNARNDSSVELAIQVTNVSGAPTMCSVVVELPKSLGFDGIGLHKAKELRIGSIDNDETKNLKVSVAASGQTPPGMYTISVTAYAHYRDYTHVLNSASKHIELRVV